jgi:hypothetical protein
MSKLVLKCGKEWLKAENLKVLKETTKLGFSEIKNRIGEDKSVAEFVLFLNDHEEIEDRLTNLISAAEEKCLEFSLFEISEDENFDEIGNTKKFEISARTLRNIFESRKETIKQLDKEDEPRFG